MKIIFFQIFQKIFFTILSKWKIFEIFFQKKLLYIIIYKKSLSFWFFFDWKNFFSDFFWFLEIFYISQYINFFFENWKNESKTDFFRKFSIQKKLFLSRFFELCSTLWILIFLLFIFFFIEHILKKNNKKKRKKRPPQPPQPPQPPPFYIIFYCNRN